MHLRISSTPFGARPTRFSLVAGDDGAVVRRPWKSWRVETPAIHINAHLLFTAQALAGGSSMRSEKKIPCDGPPV